MLLKVFTGNNIKVCLDTACAQSRIWKKFCQGGPLLLQKFIFRCINHKNIYCLFFLVIFFLQIVSSDSVMQFTLSQGLCISKKHFLPRVATSLLLPKVLIHFHIPLSLSCFLHPFLVSLWYLRPFPVLSWWLSIPQLHNSTAELSCISPILPLPLASGLCSCVPRVGVLFHLIRSVPHSLFSPLVFYPWVSMERAPG